MAKDVDRVCEKYELKLRAGRMMARTDGDHAAQLGSYRRAIERIEEIRKAVALVLGERGVSTIWWTYYYDFGRSLTKLAGRSGTPEVLRLGARTQLEVWVQRGLERSVLEAIAREVFTLDLTGPIQPLAGSPGST
jgi:hypothetical protein